MKDEVSYLGGYIGGCSTDAGVGIRMLYSRFILWDGNDMKCTHCGKFHSLNRHLCDSCYTQELLRQLREIEAELRTQAAEQEAQVADLTARITNALEGEPLDDVGNRDDNGLNYYPDLAYVRRTLEGGE